MNEVRQRLETDLAAIRSAIGSGQLEDAERMLAGISLNVSPAGEFSKRIGDLYFAAHLNCLGSAQLNCPTTWKE